MQCQGFGIRYHPDVPGNRVRWEEVDDEWVNRVLVCLLNLRLAPQHQPDRHAVIIDTDDIWARRASVVVLRREEAVHLLAPFLQDGSVGTWARRCRTVPVWVAFKHTPYENMMNGVPASAFEALQTMVGTVREQLAEGSFSKEF